MEPFNSIFFSKTESDIFRYIFFLIKVEIDVHFNLSTITEICLLIASNIGYDHFLKYISRHLTVYKKTKCNEMTIT